MIVPIVYKHVFNICILLPGMQCNIISIPFSDTIDFRGAYQTSKEVTCDYGYQTSAGSRSFWIQCSDDGTWGEKRCIGKLESSFSQNKCINTSEAEKLFHLVYNMLKIQLFQWKYCYFTTATASYGQFY